MLRLDQLNDHLAAEEVASSAPAPVSRARPQMSLFPVQSPVLIAWGAGVDSTAMIIEMVRLGERIDHVLFADTGSEKPETYAYLPIFMAWLAERSIPVTIVRYEPQRFKNYPPYRTLDENVLSNGTLPSVSFAGGSCSVKWKQEPQAKWAKSYQPAIDAWAAGQLVVKCIGFDTSRADNRRFEKRKGVHTDEHYIYRYPLREWGWNRSDCEAAIRAAGLPVPVKSACYMCAASKPHEIDALPVPLLRRIVLMESRAAPRLRNVEGLWRASVKGCRGATPRPGSMSKYIRDKGLLPTEEIDEIQKAAPLMLTAFQDAAAGVPIEQRPEFSEWLRFFDLRDRGLFDVGTQRLYQPAANSAPTPALAA